MTETFWKWDLKFKHKRHSFAHFIPVSSTCADSQIALSITASWEAVGTIRNRHQHCTTSHPLSHTRTVGKGRHTKRVQLAPDICTGSYLLRQQLTDVEFHFHVHVNVYVNMCDWRLYTEEWDGVAFEALSSSNNTYIQSKLC